MLPLCSPSTSPVLGYAHKPVVPQTGSAGAWLRPFAALLRAGANADPEPQALINNRRHNFLDKCQIRHYGLLAPANVNIQLLSAQHLLSAQPPLSASQPAAAPPLLPTALAAPSTNDTRPRCPSCGARALMRLTAPARCSRRPRAGAPPAVSEHRLGGVEKR